MFFNLKTGYTANWSNPDTVKLHLINMWAEPHWNFFFQSEFFYFNAKT